MGIETIAKCDRCPRTEQMPNDYGASLPKGWRHYTGGASMDEKNTVLMLLCHTCCTKLWYWMHFPRDRQAIGFNIDQYREAQEKL